MYCSESKEGAFTSSLCREGCRRLTSTFQKTPSASLLRALYSTRFSFRAYGVPSSTYPAGCDTKAECMGEYPRVDYRL